jgi:hypothetical protein
MALQLYAPTAVATMTMINVKDYGALGDGVTNDKPAIDLAIAAANAAGVSARGVDLYFPAGVYILSTALANYISNNVTVNGAGWQSTVIYANYTTGDILQLGNGTSKSGGGIRNLSVWCSGARTSGASINVNAMNDAVIQDVVINYCYQGVYIQGSSIKVWIDRVEINNTNSTANAAGILVTNGLAGDTYIRQVIMSNGTACTAGIQITQSGHFAIINCNVTKAVTGLLINPAAATTYVSYGFIEHSLFDSCTTNGMLISPSTSATAMVRSLTFVDSWFSGSTANPGYGIQITTAASAIVDGLNFIGCRVLNNYTHGVYFVASGPTNVSFIDCRICGNSAGSSGAADGVNLAAAVSGITISYCKIGMAGTATNTQRYAINVAAGASSDLKFTNNDCQPNVTVGTNGYINLGALTGGGNIIRDNQPCVYAGDGQASVAASAAITATETIIHPVKRYLANAIYPGTTWHFKATGTCTITTAAAVPGRFVVRMGTNGSTPASDTAVATFTLGTSAGVSGPIVFTVDIYITCRTVGASASFMAYLSMMNVGVTGIYTATTQGPLQATMATVASTGALYVYLTYGLSGSANVSCTFQEVSMSVETPGNNN